MTKITVPEFKGATLKMYNQLKSKAMTHAAVMKFKKDNKLSSAYQILFRLRKIGLKTKAFTVVAVGDTKETRSYKLVKGVAKGTSLHWVKALPVRTKTTKAKTKAKKQVKTKVAAKKTTIKKSNKKAPAKKLVHAGHSDDDVLDA